MRISIVGTVGVPGNYGGFETLAENLARYHNENRLNDDLTIYCSSKNYATKPARFLRARLIYIPMQANGVASVFYDIWSIFLAVFRGSDVIFLMGVSGAIALPFLKLFSKTSVCCNIDGIEWKREKWKGVSRWFLRLSEKIAVRYSTLVIADNSGIAIHVLELYGRECSVIAYGGDHALKCIAKPYEGDLPLPKVYALALCRVEPENNVEQILRAFSDSQTLPLVFIGNWENSSFGRGLKSRYGSCVGLHLLDPIYDAGVLRTIRANAKLYVHGHSAGGTNPSLVEMMHFGVPIIAYDCIFNRFTTDEKSLYFDNSASLIELINGLSDKEASVIGLEMRRQASERFTWDIVGADYFRLAESL